jgi:hypothetical protein
MIRSDAERRKDADRQRSARERNRPLLIARRRAAWDTDPDVDALALEAIRAPALRIHVTLDGARRELAAFHAAWAGRGLRLQPSPEQYALLVPLMILPGGGRTAAAAMVPVPPIGNTYALVGAVLSALVDLATRAAVMADATLARLAGLRPSVARLLRRGRGPSPTSPSPVTDSESSSPRATVDAVDRSRTAWHPPGERPSGDLVPLDAIMDSLGILPDFTDRSRRAKR